MEAFQAEDVMGEARKHIEDMTKQLVIWTPWSFKSEAEGREKEAGMVAGCSWSGLGGRVARSDWSFQVSLVGDLMENGFGSEKTRGVDTSEVAGAEAMVGTMEDEMD